jgi:hypothetical protein
MRPRWAGADSAPDDLGIYLLLHACLLTNKMPQEFRWALKKNACKSECMDVEDSQQESHSSPLSLSLSLSLSQLVCDLTAAFWVTIVQLWWLIVVTWRVEQPLTVLIFIRLSCVGCGCQACATCIQPLLIAET